MRRFWRAGIAQNGKSAPENGRVRRIGCRRCRQNLHHAVAREGLGSQNGEKLPASGHFLKFESPKFAPRCGARAIWKSKILKNWHARVTF